LCEGSSIRAITRITGVSKNTVAKHIADAGRACSEYQDRAFRNLKCSSMKSGALFTRRPPPSAGDVWTWKHDEAKLAVGKFIRGGGADTAGLAEDAKRLRDRLADSDFDRDLFDHNADYMPQGGWNKGKPKVAGSGRQKGQHGIDGADRIEHVNLSPLTPALGRFWDANRWDNAAMGGFVAMAVALRTSAALVLIAPAVGSECPCRMRPIPYTESADH
jgi:hypothetical protein